MSESQVLSRSDKFKSLIRSILESRYGLVELTLRGGSYVCTPTTSAKLEVFKLGNGWTVSLPLVDDGWMRNHEFKCISIDGKPVLFAEVIVDSVRFYYRK